MAAVQPRSTRSAGRAMVVGLVALAHVAAFLAASLSLPKERPPRTEPTLQTFAAVLPFAPPEPPEPLTRLSPRAQPQTLREKREVKKKPALAAAPAAPAAPAAAPSWTLPAPGTQGPAAGEIPDPYAVREALRGSVGCDMENLKLRPDEQARCADRTGRWARKGRKIGPAGDDPKRAAELAAEEDYQRRKHEWKTTDCGIHNGHDELDAKGALGQMAPRRGESKDGEDEERANAC